MNHSSIYHVIETIYHIYYHYKELVGIVKRVHSQETK